MRRCDPPALWICFRPPLAAATETCSERQQRGTDEETAATERLRHRSGSSHEVTAEDEGPALVSPPSGDQVTIDVRVVELASTRGATVHAHVSGR